MQRLAPPRRSRRCRRRFSVPARRPVLWPPPGSVRRKRRTVAHDQRADALRPAELVRRQRQVIAQRGIERDLARRRAPHRPAAARRASLHQRARLPRSAGSRRSRCWPPSPRPARGPCLRASARAALRDRPRRPPSPAMSRAARPATRSASALGVGQHRVMLDGRDEQPRDARLPRFAPRLHRAPQRQRVGFGAAAGEDHVLRPARRPARPPARAPLRRWRARRGLRACTEDGLPPTAKRCAIAAAASGRSGEVAL